MLNPVSVEHLKCLNAYSVNTLTFQRMKYSHQCFEVKIKQYVLRNSKLYIAILLVTYKYYKVQIYYYIE